MSDDDIENDFDTDDFDTDGFDDGGFDDLNDQRGTLGDLWRNNPLVKIGVILAAFAFLVGGVILFGGKSDRLPVSSGPRKVDVTGVPGGEQGGSDTYIKALEEQNAAGVENSVKGGTSFIPVPTSTTVGTLPQLRDEPEEEDPLERWRRMQEERIQQQQVEAKKPNAVPEVPVDTRTPAIQALSQAMSQQMDSVLGNQKINGPTVQSVATMSYLEGLAEKERQALEAALAAQAALSGNVVGDDLNILLPAGTIEYAQLLTEANTDAPGPILAQIATGPLKGGRLIGSFTATDNYLTLNFNTIVLDGVDYAAQGIAIDPDTTLPGVVTDIDRRYFRRIVLPMAAEFVTGLADAISESGTTTVTISGDTVTETTSNNNQDNDQEVASGVSAAGSEFADILDEIADGTQPLLRVRAGTPVGVLFIAPVVGTPNITQLREQERQRQLTLPSATTTTTTPTGASGILSVLP